jgi:hypothetical protein
LRRIEPNIKVHGSWLMGVYASIGFCASITGSGASSRSRVSGVANNRVEEIALSLGDAF